MKLNLKCAPALGVLLAYFILTSAFTHTEAAKVDAQKPNLEIDLKEEAFSILDTKCNICHRKQNPFMIFKMKNMEHRAKKIYTQVFVKRRMPKGDEITLSMQEYATLKNWLNTLNIQLK